MRNDPISSNDDCLPIQNDYQAHALQKLVSLSTDVLCLFDAYGRFTHANAAAENHWGYAPAELQGRHYFDFLPEKDRSAAVEAICNLPHNPSPVHLENYFYSKSGQLVPVQWALVWEENDKKIYAIAKNISRQKDMEEKAKANALRLSRAFKLARLGWWEWSFCQNAYHASDELYAILGLNKTDYPIITVQDFLALVHPNDRADMEEHLKHIQHLSNKPFTHRIIKPNGDIRYLKHYGQTIKDEYGNAIAIHGTTKDITEYRKAKVQLQESEKKLAGILESLGDGFYAVDKNWTVTYWNKKAEELLSKNRQDIIGKNLWQEYKEAVQLQFYTAYHQAMAQKIPVHFEEYFAPVNMWFEVSAYPSQDGLSVYFKNITSRKEQEEIQKKNIQRIKRIQGNLVHVLESMTDGFFIVDRSYTIKYATDKTAAMIGVNKEEYIGKNLWEAFPMAGNMRFKSEYKRAFAEGAPVCFQEFMPGYNMWFEVNAYPHKETLTIFIKDITRQKQNEERLLFISRAASEVIWERDIGSDEVVINHEKFNLVFGYQLSSDHIDRSVWFDKIHPDDAGRLSDNSEYALNNEFNFYLNEYRYLKADGTWAYVKDRTYIVCDHQNKPVKMIGAMEDVTVQRQQEKALIESENSYKRLFQEDPAIKVVIDEQTLRFLDVNAAAIAHYGYSREEFLSRTILDIRPIPDRLRAVNAMKNINRNARNDLGRWTHIKKSGERILVEISLIPIIYKGKSATLVSITDITEKIKLQEALVQEKVNRQKSITKATITAQEKQRSDIGRELHDNINQILTTAKLYVENIKCFPAQQESFIDKSVNLLQKSINEIRSLSRALVTPAVHTGSFEEILRELMASYKELNQFAVECEFDFNEACIDKELRLTLYRILQEQLNNTVKYARASQVTITLRQHQQLTLLYTDNGIGFDPATQKKGLGLNNIKNRAEVYNGQVHIHSAPGHGCCMKVTFPLGETCN